MNRWGSVAAADGAAEASGPVAVAVGGDIVTDDVEDAEEADVAGAPPATDGRVVAVAGASAR